MLQCDVSGKCFLSGRGVASRFPSYAAAADVVDFKICSDQADDRSRDFSGQVDDRSRNFSGQVDDRGCNISEERSQGIHSHRFFLAADNVWSCLRPHSCLSKNQAPARRVPAHMFFPGVQ